MQIQRTNQMITYHQSFEDTDNSAVENFKDLRKDFLGQLGKLFEELNLEVRLKEAA